MIPSKKPLPSCTFRGCNADPAWEGHHWHWLTDGRLGKKGDAAFIQTHIDPRNTDVCDEDDPPYATRCYSAYGPADPEGWCYR